MWHGWTKDSRLREAGTSFPLDFRCVTMIGASVTVWAWHIWPSSAQA
jgi:hypothetical protein